MAGIGWTRTRRGIFGAVPAAPKSVTVSELEALLQGSVSISRSRARTAEWLRQNVECTAPILVWAVLPENTAFHSERTGTPLRHCWRCGVVVRLRDGSGDAFLMDVLVETFNRLPQLRIPVRKARELGRLVESLPYHGSNKIRDSGQLNVEAILTGVGT